MFSRPAGDPDVRSDNENKLRAALLGVLLLAVPALEAGQTQYVTDFQEVTLRAGETTGHKILKMLGSGDRVEVLRTNEKSGWAQVKTPDGTVGYVLARYLMKEPGAREQLEAATKRLAELEGDPAKTANQLAQYQQSNEQLTTANQELEQTKQRLEQELAEIRRASADVIRIDTERKDLRVQVVALLRQVEELKQEALDLDNRRNQSWFLIGAGVVLTSFFLGWLLPNIRIGRRKRDWNYL
jgi:SH3 domain protein